MIEDELRRAGFTPPQATEFARLDPAYVHRWLDWIKTPGRGILNPIAFAVDGMRNHFEPPASDDPEPLPITAEQRDRFGTEAEQRAREKYPNATSMLPVAIDREIRALVAEECAS